MNFNEDRKEVEIGCDEPVKIDKMFGPAVFATLRITADYERGWVIERQWIETGEWIEWCVIPAQIEQEFTSEG
jgi:hypothetical protein